MAVRFDAATDKLTHAATSPPEPSSGITITYWANLAVDRNDFSTMIRLHGGAVPGSTTTINVAMGASGDTPSIFTVGGTVTGPAAVTLDTWHRIAITVTGTTGTIYTASGTVGTVFSNAGTIGYAASPTGFTIGGRSATDDTEWFNGRMAYLRMWSAVLSQANIEAEWASTDPVRTSGLWGNYNLAHASDLADSSGNGRDLTAGSTPVSTEDGPPLEVSETRGVLTVVNRSSSVAQRGNRLGTVVSDRRRSGSTIEGGTRAF